MQNDFIPSQARDYIIDGETFDLKEEIKKWGGFWNSNEKRWELKGTQSGCPDYDHLKRMGLKLYPIQCTSEEKTIQDILRRNK